MRSGYFSMMIIIQTILLAVTPAIFAFSLANENLVITRFNILIIWILQIVFLIYYLHKPTRELARTFESFSSVRSISVPTASKKEIFGIRVDKEFGKITETINSLRIQKEKEYQLYHKCIENALTGLLAIDESGRILARNKAFSSILGTGEIESIEKLNELKEGLGDYIFSVNEETRKMFTLVNNGKILKIYLTISVFRQDSLIIRILAIQDIGPEIAMQQTETMQRFVRMMSHEILNSVTPINLMASGLIIKHGQDAPCHKCGHTNGPKIKETLDILETIKKRSKSLAAFVESFRKTYNIPEPVVLKTDIGEIFRHINLLLRKQLENIGIRLEINQDRAFKYLMADRKLIEQVIINLIMNSSEALKSIENPVIKLSAYLRNDRPEIEVRDNGCGMDTDTIEKLAIPFYTTREKGTGSGLFFSRQVMRIHKGELIILSDKNQGTTVRLLF